MHRLCGWSHRYMWTSSAHLGLCDVIGRSKVGDGGRRGGGRNEKICCLRNFPPRLLLNPFLKCWLRNISIWGLFITHCFAVLRSEEYHQKPSLRVVIIFREISLTLVVIFQSAFLHGNVGFFYIVLLCLYAVRKWLISCSRDLLLIAFIVVLLSYSRLPQKRAYQFSKLHVFEQSKRIKRTCTRSFQEPCSGVLRVVVFLEGRGSDMKMV